MSQLDPMVCAILLTKNRPDMAQRAISSFRAQTYPRKKLLIVNSGPGPIVDETDTVQEPCFVGADTLHIGGLRNLGNRYALSHYVRGEDRPEFLCHFDDDDVSHPSRIAEQVALFEADPALQLVGYRTMLFWKTTPGPQIEGHGDTEGAWLYVNHDPRYSLGTSFMYRVETWQARPFNERERFGEDLIFMRDIEERKGVGSIALLRAPVARCEADEPRMICSIHGGNTHSQISTTSPSWQRVTEFDGYCREKMKL